MNQEELLSKVGNWITETAQQIGDFAAREIPPFINEYLTWKFWENAFYIFSHFMILAILIVIALIVWKIAKYLKKKQNECLEKEHRSDASDYETGFYITSIILIIYVISSLSIWTAQFPTENVKNCIQIKIAPKVYLIERGAELYKQNK